MPMNPLPRLPQHPPSHTELQIWWQQVCEQIERQEAAQDELLEELQNQQAELDAQQAILAAAVQDIIDILVRLGEVEVLADGTLAIVDQGLNADGTVKDNKVLTTSVSPTAVTQVDSEVQVGTVGPVLVDTEATLITNTLDTVPAGATGVLVLASFYADDPTDNTLKVRSRLKKNGTEVQKGFLRNDGTSVLIHFDAAPVTGDIYTLTYAREGEDFTVARGQILALYLKR